MPKALVLTVLLLGTTCFADSLDLFQIDGTLKSGATDNIVGTFAGTIEIDTTTGSIVSWNLPLPFVAPGYDEAGISPFTFTPSNSGVLVSNSQISFRYDNLFGLNFTIPENTLIGFTGSGFIGDYEYPRSRTPDFYVTSGTITSAVAPEPSSLLLMASGLAGMFVFRRKLFGGTLQHRCS